MHLQAITIHLQAITNTLTGHHMHTGRTYRPHLHALTGHHNTLTGHH